MNALRTTWACAVLLPLVVAGCGGAAVPAEPAPAPDTPAAAAAKPRDADAASREELEALYRARMDSARTRHTDADVAFMRGMIHHHAQAIEMARLAPERTDSRPIRTLAARIINAQEDEIATMQEWLRERGLPVPEVRDGSHGGDHDVLMPGMLTGKELRELERASGAAFDRLLLTYMIRHHQGAVAMVHALFDTDGAAQDEAVFRFASDAQVDQATEIARMERMLAALTADAPSS